MSSERTPLLQVVPYGPPARAALAAAITELRADDPLAPVTVVVPSALAGLTLRRALAAELGGLVGVGFESLPGLAQRVGAARLAAGGRAPLDRLTARALVAAALAERPGRFAASARHPATVAALADTIAELRPLRGAELELLSRASARAAEVVALHRGVAARATAFVDDHDALVAAVAAVDAGDPIVAEIGAVVLHLPRVLTRPELALVAALAGRGAVRAIVGATGRPGADAVVDEVVAALGQCGLGSAASPEGVLRSGAVGSIAVGSIAVGSIAVGSIAVGSIAVGSIAPGVEGTTVVLAPDPSEEARHAVRVVVEALGRGVAAERIAIVSRVAEPYALLVHEELAAAGLPHSAPSPARLGQTIAGRTLLALLRWGPDGHRRDALLRLLRGAPVRGVDGANVRADRWDRIARDAGVVAGLSEWQSRLAARRASVAEWLRDRDPAELEQKLADIDELGAFVGHLATVTDVGGVTGWGPLSRWAKDVLRTTLGSEVRAEAASSNYSGEHEHAARIAVDGLLDQLGALHGIGPEPDLEAFLATLDHELQAGSGRVGRFGHGITVARLVDVVGADLDVVVVLGATEGVFPPRPVDDALLPARERRAVGALRPRGSTRAEEERDVWAALAAAPACFLSTSAADPRAQREQHPAPWLVELVGQLAGDDVTAADLRRRDLSGVVRIDSFQAWLAEGHAPVTAAERDIAELLAAHRAGVDVRALPTASAVGISRGLDAIRARNDGAFGEWTGNVGRQPILTGEMADHRSPTGLEQYAICPFRFFLGKVLGVRELEDPAVQETIDPRDRGSLVHEVLESFVTRHLGQDMHLVWVTPEARAELAGIADEVEHRYRSAGRTGRPLLWGAEWAALRRHLGRVVEHGLAAEELLGVRPLAVEHAFGFGEGEAPAVEVEVGLDRPLRFGGRIDRIDRSEDGKRVVVVDYKTSGSFDYRGLGSDVVQRGTKLQLPIYAAAARELVPEAEEVSAFYWFVSPRHRVEMQGRVIDDDANERFRDVLHTVVGGIEDGLFPARPGKDTWRQGVGDTYEGCLWCEYDRVCPKGRGEQWVHVKTHGALAKYVDLAEGELPVAGPT